MCRFVAYHGAPVRLERVVFEPPHSLVNQSARSEEAKIAVHGDGFGLAWYNDLPEPGRFRDILPAWSDCNLRSLCRTIASPLFLAHVRAATTGGTARENCHPFVQGKWSFMHNGMVGDFAKIRRPLEARLSDPLYQHRYGTTDSELLFLLLISEGLEEDPGRALNRVISLVNEAKREVGAKKLFRLTCTFSDGERLYAFRYANDNKSPTLYLSKEYLPNAGILASEPLDADSGSWQLIEEGKLLVV